MVDAPLLKAILARWKPRFESDAPEWGDTALYRALNMAFSAASLPGNVEATIHDIGKAISLCVSAFEILAHTGEASGYLQVYSLLEKTAWNLTACNEAVYEPLGVKSSQGKRSLPIWLYGELHRARNDFLHGNRIDAMRLIVAPAKRPLHTYALPSPRQIRTTSAVSFWTSWPSAQIGRTWRACFPPSRTTFSTCPSPSRN
jgi:hypothetical protein